MFRVITDAAGAAADVAATIKRRYPAKRTRDGVTGPPTVVALAYAASWLGSDGVSTFPLQVSVMK